MKGEHIPLILRIIAIAETYERVLNRGELSLAERKRSAAEVIRNGAATQFDPKIAALFVQILDEKTQEEC